MPYQYEYINELIESNKKFVSLILTDDEGLLASMRLEKQFCAISSTEQDMIDSAQVDIDYYTANQPQVKLGASLE